MNIKHISEEYFKGFNGKDISRFFIEENLQAAITKTTCKKTYSLKAGDKRDVLIVGFCLEGEMTIDNKVKEIISEGQMFYFRPRESFNISSLSHSSLHYLIDLNQLKDFLCCKDFNNTYKKGRLKIEKIPYIIESYIKEIKEIKDTEENMNLLDYLNLKSLLLNNLNWTLKLNSTNQSFIEGNKDDEYYIYRTKEIITENLEQQIPIKFLVENLGISLYKLQKIFKRSYSTTVYDFIRKVKIDNSKVFLRDTNLSIIDISQKLGYENPSKFSTAFKNITGHTPTEYRKSIIN